MRIRSFNSPADDDDDYDNVKVKHATETLHSWILVFIIQFPQKVLNFPCQ